MDTSNQQLVDETKPVVWLYTVSTQVMENNRQIRLGLEEEGIPCELREVSGESAHTLAVAAARLSSLGVGVGLVDSAMEAVVHHRDLLDTEKLIEVKGGSFRLNLLRRLGVNAARLTKGGALLEMKEEESEIQDVPLSVGFDSSLGSRDHEEVEVLRKIVVEVINALNSSKELL